MMNEVLNGLDEIRKYWDPHMSESYFKKHILPVIRDHLFTRDNYLGRRKKNIPKYYTYKTLLLSVKIRYEKMD